MHKWTFKLARMANGYAVDNYYGDTFVFADATADCADEINQLASLVEAMKFIVGQEIPMTVSLCESAGIEVVNHHCSDYSFDVGVDIIEPDDDDDDEDEDEDEDDACGSMVDDAVVFGELAECEHLYTVDGGGQLAIGGCRKYNLVDVCCDEDCPDIDEEFSRRCAQRAKDGWDNDDEDLFDDTFSGLGRT